MYETEARDLAKQLREHINYQGDIKQFDDEIVKLVQHVVSECAKVVEDTPKALFLMSSDPRPLIALAVRGYFKK